MSDRIQNIDIRIGAKDEASKVMEQVRKEAKDLRASLAGSSFFSGVRESLGRRSAIGEIADTFKTGGGRLVGGLTEAIKGVGDLAEKASQFRREFQEGTKSAAELREEFLKAVPIIGQARTAGQEIRNFFTGELSDIEEEKARAENLNKVLDLRLEIMKEQAKVAEEIAQHFKEVRAEISGLGVGASGKPLADLRIANAKTDTEVAKDAATGEKRLHDKFDPLIAAANKASDAKTAGDQTIARDKAIAENLAQITEKHRADYLLNQAKYEQAVKESQEHITQTIRAGERQTGDVLAKVREGRLREAGQGFEAQRDALRHSLDDRLEVLAESRKREAEMFDPADTENQQAVNKRYRAAADAAVAESDMNLDSARKEAAKQLDETNAKIQQMKAEAIRDATGITDKQAEIEAQFAQKRRELVELSQSAYLTDVQRLKVGEQLAALAGQEAEAKQRSVRDAATQARADFGDPGAAADQKRQKVETEYKEARAGLEAELGRAKQQAKQRIMDEIDKLAGSHRDRLRDLDQEPIRAGLQARASFGDQQAANDLKKQDVEKQYKEAKAALEAARDKASASDKAKYNDQLKRLAISEKQALSRVGNDPDAINRRAEAIDESHSSGMTEAKNLDVQEKAAAARMQEMRDASPDDSTGAAANTATNTKEMADFWKDFGPQLLTALGNLAKRMPSTFNGT